MQPHLVRWQQQYGPQGLQIVYVADARRLSPEGARAFAAQQPFAVYYDVGGAWNQAVSVGAYPTAYIGRRSENYRVGWEGIPVFNPGETEQALRAALAR